MSQRAAGMFALVAVAAATTLRAAGSPTCQAIGLPVRSRTGWKADDERLVRGQVREGNDRGSWLDGFGEKVF